MTERSRRRSRPQSSGGGVGTRAIESARLEACVADLIGFAAACPAPKVPPGHRACAGTPRVFGSLSILASTPPTSWGYRRPW
jgi:hypothetical protein